MLAVQFHPEVTPKIVRRWAATASADADKYGIHFESVISQSDDIEQDARARCYSFVDAFLDTFC